MEVSFSPNFLKSVHALSSSLQEEVIEKVELFRHQKNHPALKVHKLHGRLRGCYAFSVNYHTRIIFEYFNKPRRAFLLSIGNHDDIYDV
mgnify:CR=1